MKSVAEIKKELAMCTVWEPWMDELKTDSRRSIQTLLTGWRRKLARHDALIHNHELKINFDSSYKMAPADLIAGIDEAGRGPLAGPVVTAAVILPADCSRLVGLDDSKKLSLAKRNHYAEIIKEIAVSYAVHIQPPEEIDRLNIYQATKMSMTAAAVQLDPQPAVILADAMKLDVSQQCESIIKGDTKSLAIAAASILAKTGRDALMDSYAEEYPQYGFNKHAGYGTKEHVAALNEHGPCPIHRKTFEPVKSILLNKTKD